MPHRLQRCSCHQQCVLSCERRRDLIYFNMPTYLLEEQSSHILQSIFGRYLGSIPDKSGQVPWVAETQVPHGNDTSIPKGRLYIKIECRSMP